MKLNINSVLFLGVGGISMHQLAIAFKNLGVKVYGYDAKLSKYTNVVITGGHLKGNDILVEEDNLHIIEAIHNPRLLCCLLLTRCKCHCNNSHC